LPWLWDRGNSVNVKMQYGTPPVTATEDAVLNDATLNLVLMGGEYFQYVTRTLEGDGSWTFSTLLRGLRGTEQYIATHVVGENLLVIDSTLGRRDLGASEIGDTDHYRAVTPGRDISGAITVVLPFTAAAHRPYSPVHGVLLRDTVTDDWSISATRRTRVGGANVDGQAVPLGEVSEAWEADVLDGGDVVRTLSGTSLPLVYTAAQQVTDFGVEQTALDINLYQISPTLALRGFPLNIAA
jgi:hypothetical protein